MAQFFIRIQLDGVPSSSSEKIYNSLHEALARHAIVRMVDSNNGMRKLPWAVYTLEANLTVEQVAGLANTTAKAVWPTCQVLAIQSEGWHSYGLEQA